MKIGKTNRSYSDMEKQIITTIKSDHSQNNKFIKRKIQISVEALDGIIDR
jgi:hypothetical protein